MKTIIFSTTVLLLNIFSAQAQIKNSKTETVKVYGNCDMCKATIEKTGNKKKLTKTVWDADSKMATITYDSTKTNLSKVLKSFALVGYDNMEFLAPDAAYNKLPACCKYERQKKTTLHKMTGAPIKDSSKMKDEQVKVNAQEATELSNLFTQYFALKNALVKSDGITSAANAAAMVTAYSAIKMEALNPAEHAVWMKVEKTIQFNAQHIAETKDIKHQREHFMALSTDMYELMKVAKSTTPVYYQFCPMANDGKGANWLSQEMAVKNPYYGSMMLSCGKVVETIKQ
jgi:hypothetical protein